MTRSGADLRGRFRFDPVDGLLDYLIERRDLLIVQAVGIADEKIGDASERIAAFVRRAIAQDFARIVKKRRVGLGHCCNTRTEGDLAPLPDSPRVKIGSVPKKRQLLKTRAIKTLFGIKIYESISK